MENKIESVLINLKLISKPIQLVVISKRSLLELSSQSLSAFSSSSRQNLSSISGCHSFSETMFSLTLFGFRLKSHLHIDYTSLF